jgi:hypothetical protein
MQDQHGKSKLFIYFKRFFLLITMIVAIPILIPLGLIFAGPVISIDFVYRRISSNVNFVMRILAMMLTFIIGLILNPFIWIGLIVLYSP